MWLHFFFFQERIENELRDIDALFTALLDVVNTAWAKARRPLEDKLLLLNKESRNLKDELGYEIDKLETTLSKLDDLSTLDDHILFLQVRSYSITMQILIPHKIMSSMRRCKSFS